MQSADPLTIDYRAHARVSRLIETLRDYLEEIALGFGRWGEERVYGPGIYLAVVVGPSVASFADSMGANRWPADAPRDAIAAEDGFMEGLSTVAYTFDGAVVVSVDGIVNRQMVRFRMANISPDLDYEPWMGARHMSAMDVSTRQDVVATLTLSEETGRVTLFEDGEYESRELAEIGTPWRAEEAAQPP